MIKLWSVCTLTAVFGIGAGWALHGSGSADSAESALPAAARMTQLAAAAPPTAPQSELDLAQLHAAIREELAAASKSQPGSERQAAATQSTAPPSPELLAQRREAVQDIQQMIAAGQWGNAERAQFQQKFATLDPEQARKVLQQVVTGLNNGTIQAQTDLPL
jgi:hypothetical protein